MGDELTFTVVNGVLDLEGALDQTANFQLVSDHGEQEDIMTQHHIQQDEGELVPETADDVANSYIATVPSEDVGLDAGQQILTIDGKQLFVVTADGNFAAVTAECLEQGGISIAGATIGSTGEVEGINEDDQDYEEPEMKKIKIEQDQDVQQITLENGLVVGMYNNPQAEEEQNDIQTSLVLSTPNTQVIESSSVNMSAVTTQPTWVINPKLGEKTTAKVRSAGGAVAGAGGSSRVSINATTAEAMDPSQAWFTTKDDKQTLSGRGHSWKQGQWGKDEVDLLQNNIAKYCTDHNINDPTEIIFEMSKDERKDFYRTIARGLNRPLFSVYRRVIRMYDQKNHIGKYTPEEMTKLRELRTLHGNDWAKIGSAMGRSASSVKDKCRLMREMCNAGKWLPEEEKRLADAVYRLSGTEPGENVVTGLSWAAVAENVGSRSEKQCRTKWLNYLNWKQQGGSEWTRMDDIRLMDRIAETAVNDETDVDWNQLTENWSSVRSPQWLRGKWWTLKRVIADYQILPFMQLVALAREYHSQSLRASLPGSTTVKPRPAKINQTPQQLALQHTTIDAATQYLVSLPANSNLSGEVDDGSGLISYEVLPQGLAGHPGAAFLITQPTGGSGDNAARELIVHSIPAGQQHTQDSMDNCVIVDEHASVPPSQSSQLGIEHVSVEEDKADTAAAEAAAELHMQLSMHPGDGDGGEDHHHHHTEEDDDHMVLPHHLGGAGSVICSEDVGQEAITLSQTSYIQASDDHTSVIEDTVTELNLHAASQSPSTYTRSTSDGDLIHMSSLSDPMLPSDGADLIGCADIDGHHKSESEHS